MEIIQWINAIIVTIGIPTIAVVLINIGEKFKALSDLENEAKNIIRPELKEIRGSISSLSERISALETSVGFITKYLLKEK